MMAVERHRSKYAERNEKHTEKYEDYLRWLYGELKASHLTPQAQRPGPRDAAIASGARWPGSLQRMVRHHGDTS